MYEPTSQTFQDELDRLLVIDRPKLVDRAKVIDSLLDLRLSATTGGLQTRIDEVLKAVPGRTLVESIWFAETLRSLAVGAAEPEYAG